MTKFASVAVVALMVLMTGSVQAFCPLTTSGVKSTKVSKSLALEFGHFDGAASRQSSGEQSKTALHGFFFNQKEKKQVAVAPPPEPVVIDPDFRVGALFLALGGLLDTIPWIQLTLGPLVTALGVLFIVQTFRLRFVFDETAFELATVKTTDKNLNAPGENIIVGGTNRWATERIFNYDFYPEGWIDGPIGPILVYFKEDQTPSDSWNEGPGKMANDPAKVEAGLARPGQVHFFPAVANAQQIREEFEKRGCKRI